MSDRPTALNVPGLRPPGGHYSAAMQTEGLIFLSGQLPLPPSGPPDDIGFDEQVRRVMGSLLAILAAAGGGPEDLVKVTVYLAGIEYWDRFNQLYAGIMGDAKPARSIVPVPALHFGYLVELDAIAVRRAG